MIHVFIGYDPREAVSYHVLSHSIMRRASEPVSITPLYLPYLESSGLYRRARDPNQSTDFTFSRFLVPYLTGFRGTPIFMDCDMLCLGDVAELANLARHDPYQDVFVVKHAYTPRTDSKFLDQPQTVYPCKNWSSVMVFNTHRSPVRSLRPDYVNNATGMQLHQFKWAESVGELPKEWNHLVGEYEPNTDAKLVHYTLGGPWFSEYQHCEFSRHWYCEAANALHAGKGKERLPEVMQHTIIHSNSIGNDYADLQAQAETETETPAAAKAERTVQRHKRSK